MPLTGRDRLLNFINHGTLPEGFYYHERHHGERGHQCVFCKKEVSYKMRSDDHGYFIILFGPVPVPISAREVELVEKEVECTICLNCDDDINRLNDRVTDSYFNLEEFIQKGKYPDYIINFSLQDDCSQFCFLCRKRLENEDHSIHYIPTGYYRNNIEPSNIPGPLSMCLECEEHINESKRNNEYEYLTHYSLDTCYQCGDSHLISKTEEDYRIENGTKGQYLCPECAIENGLTGIHRIVIPVCKGCGKGNRKKIDILHKDSKVIRIDHFYCEICEKSATDLYLYDIDQHTRIEVYSSQEKWFWVIVQIYSTRTEDDGVIGRAKHGFSNPYDAMFEGVLKVMSSNQLKLKL